MAIAIDKKWDGKDSLLVTDSLNGAIASSTGEQKVINSIYSTL